MNEEVKRKIIGEGCLTEANYPFVITPNFSTLGSIMEKLPNRGIRSSFFIDDGIHNRLGYKPTVLHEDFKLSDNPVDNLSFDNVFLETNIAQSRIFKGKRTGKKHNFTMNVSPGYNNNVNI